MIIASDAEMLSSELDSKLLQFEKVVILGCTGMLGNYFSNVMSHYYSKRNSLQAPPVLGVSRSSSKKCESIQENFPGVFKQIDYSELPEMLRKAGNTLVIHCASPSSIQEINTDPVGAVFTNLEVTSFDVGNNVVNIIPEQATLKFNVRFTDNLMFANRFLLVLHF
jgi:hypothetical protein